MTYRRVVFSIELLVKSPFLFSGLHGGLLGVDISFLRDEAGRAIIPSDQVRGVFREALNDMAEAGALKVGLVDDLFGQGSDRNDDLLSSNDPVRGKVRFSDLTAPKDTWGGEITRIAIDDDLGAVKTGALQVIELAAPLGSSVVFKGKVVLYASEREGEDWEKRLRQALSLVVSVGAVKSAGFGEVLAGSSVRFESSSSLALNHEPREILKAVRLRVSFDRPLLVDARKVADNAFEGAETIPGAVFKGALARRLELAGETGWDDALSRLSFSHAFPESGVTGIPAGLPLPLSLVYVKGEDEVPGVFGDALNVGMDRGAMIRGKPALFQTDWKPHLFALAATVVGWPPYHPVPLLARTHTAIDPRTGTADDQKLFTTISRSVRCVTDENRIWKDRTWILDIDLPDNDPMAQRLIDTLIRDGLDGIGKTGAETRFKNLERADDNRAAVVYGTQSRYAVMLATPALMIDPAKVLGADGWKMKADEAYEAYWTEILPGCKLINFFASQTYTGGYLAKRRRLYPGSYFPFLLTRPGSVFLIETQDHAALVKLCREGLPVTNRDGVGTPTWQNCPYMPENGYGRIKADYLSDAKTAELLGCVDTDTPEMAE